MTLESIDLSQDNYDALEDFEIGTAMKSVHPLTSKQENVFWARSIFSVHTAEGLLKVVFRYNCKYFSLQGGDEHCELERDQYSIGSNEVGRYLHFMGSTSKNVRVVSNNMQSNLKTSKYM